MLLDDIKQLKRGKSELRKFGLLVGGVFTVLGLLWLLRGKAHPSWLLAPGIALVALGATIPGILKPFYLVWMSLALVLGFIVSHVLLTVFFFLAITPIGVIARLTGKDFLRLKLQRDAKSYWIPRNRPAPKTPAEYERQY
jgi:hypothetical protein